MEDYSFIVFLIYMVLIIYIIPKSGVEFDMHRIRFRLLPHWFKFTAISLIVISVILAILFYSQEEKWLEYLMSLVNLSLFIFIFSKQKQEDEFAEYTRFKSLTYTFVSLVGMLGAFSVLDIGEKTIYILNNQNLQFLLAVAMLMSLLYFYISLYRFKKSQ